MYLLLKGEPIVQAVKNLAALLICAAVTMLAGSASGFAQTKADDITTPEKCWQARAARAPISTLSSDGEKLYLGSDDGRLTAVNLRNGENIWSADLGGRFASNLVTDASAVFEASSAVLPAGEKGALTLRAISKSSGVVNWTAILPVSDSFRLFSSGEVIIAAAANGGISAYDAATGKSLWSRQAQAAGVVAVPARQSEFVTIISGEKAVIILAKSGGIVSEFKPSGRSATVAASDEKYLFAGDDRGSLTAYDATEGTKLWRFKTGANLRFVAGTDAGVLAVSDDNFVYMLSRERGSVIWKRRTPGRIFGNPALSSSTLIFSPLGEAAVYALALESGKIVSQITTGESEKLVAAPILASDGVIVTPIEFGIAVYSLSACSTNRKTAP